MKWLKRVRVAMGVTQDALAKGTKIHQTTLSRIENGYKKVDKATEALIISCLGGKKKVERYKGLVASNGEKD